MDAEHIDRQPPRDDAEEAEQDRLIAEGASGTPTELSTEAADPDVEPGSDSGGEPDGE